MDAWQHPAIEFAHHVFQNEDVAIKEAPKVLRARFNLVVREEVSNDGRIRAPREMQPESAVEDAELVAQDFRESLFPCPARGNKRPVDIEQNEANHTPRGR